MYQMHHEWTEMNRNCVNATSIAIADERWLWKNTKILFLYIRIVCVCVWNANKIKAIKEVYGLCAWVSTFETFRAQRKISKHSIYRSAFFVVPLLREPRTIGPKTSLENVCSDHHRMIEKLSLNGSRIYFMYIETTCLLLYSYERGKQHNVWYYSPFFRRWIVYLSWKIFSGW